MNQDQKKREFVETMMPFSNQLYSYACYFTGDNDAAGDLLQETYLRAFRFFDKFDRGTNARAWLHTIMKNTYINSYRQKKRSPIVVEFNEQRFLPHFNHASGDIAGALDHVFGDEVVNALSSLPTKFKSIVILRDIEDMPYEEIAEVLQIPIGTVRSRLHRARAILFSKLKSYAKASGREVNDRFAPRNFTLAAQ
jgi:RNA polymerase sigma-70 factor (ECF subfamily)